MIDTSESFPILVLILRLERGGGRQILLSRVYFLITQPFFNIYIDMLYIKLKQTTGVNGIV